MQKLLIASVFVLLLVAALITMQVTAADKVTICHKGDTKEVPQSAVGGHTGHGDTLGPCSVSPHK